MTTTVCDKSTKTIKCGPAGRIKIKSAFYGRTSWSVCSHGWYFNIRPCSANSILQKMVALCDNKTECSLKSPPDDIDDPCPVFTKYLTIVHTCDSKFCISQSLPDYHLIIKTGFLFLLKYKLRFFPSKPTSMLKTFKIRVLLCYKTFI